MTTSFKGIRVLLLGAVVAVAAAHLGGCSGDGGSSSGGGSGSKGGGSGSTGGGSGSTGGGTGATGGGSGSTGGGSGSTGGGSGSTGGGSGSTGGGSGTTGGGSGSTGGGSGSTGGGSGSTGGGSGSTGGGAGGGSGGGSGGGGVVIDAGMLLDAGCPTATFTFSTDGGCKAPNPACGGDPTGRWCYTGYCLESTAVFPQATQVCDALNFPVTFTNVNAVINAVDTFTGTPTEGIVERYGTYIVAGTAHVPAGCKNLVGFTCLEAQNGFKQFTSSASCVDDNGGCKCDFTVDHSSGPNPIVSAYTTDAGTLAIDAGSGTGSKQNYKYCISGGTSFSYGSTDGTGEPGVGTLTKQ